MNSSNYRFSLDVQSSVSQISLPVRLGDTYRTLYITLNDGGVPFTIEDGCVAIISAKKADGKYLANSCTIKRNSVVKVKFTEQTANTEGIVDCEIRLYAPSGDKLTSARFIMVVSPRAIGENDVALSEDEKNILDAIGVAEAARNGAELAREEAESKRVDAENKRVSAESARATADAKRDANIAEAHNAIAILSKQLADEAKVRGDMDTTLMNSWIVPIFNQLQALQGWTSEQISTEQQARANKDAALQEQIDEVSSSTSFATQALNQKVADLQSQVGTINETLNSFINVAEVGA